MEDRRSRNQHITICTTLTIIITTTALTIDQVTAFGKIVNSFDVTYIELYRAMCTCNRPQTPLARLTSVRRQHFLGLPMVHCFDTTSEKLGPVREMMMTMA